MTKHLPTMLVEAEMQKEMRRAGSLARKRQQVASSITDEIVEAEMQRRGLKGVRAQVLLRHEMIDAALGDA